MHARGAHDARIDRGCERADDLIITIKRARISAMVKIRHIAIQVPDLEKSAAFYEGVLGLIRVGEAESPIGNAIILSDGTINLTLLNVPEGHRGASTVRTGRGCIISGCWSMMRMNSPGKSRHPAANFSEKSPPFPVFKRRPSTRIPPASCSTSLNTTGRRRNCRRDAE